MDVTRWILRGATLGLIVLGVGGRLLMRVIAHREQRPAMVFTVEGTLTVLLAGTAAGVFAGVIYYLLRRFVRDNWVRTTAFVLICGLVAWRGVHGLLLVPQLMFMGLALLFLILMDALGRRTPVVPAQTSIAT